MRFSAHSGSSASWDQDSSETESGTSSRFTRGTPSSCSGFRIASESEGWET